MTSGSSLDQLDPDPGVPDSSPSISFVGRVGPIARVRLFEFPHTGDGRSPAERILSPKTKR